MNWKDEEGRGLWYYPGIFQEKLKKTMKTHSTDSQYPGQDLKPGPPE
jgi:hypothetical protein